MQATSIKYSKILFKPMMFFMVTSLILFPQTMHADISQISNAKSVDVVIVGAGLAGLSTAYRLKKAGLTYQIVELSPHIGGRIRTGNYPEGQQAEAGLEEFWSSNPTLEIIEDLKIPKELSATSFSSYVSEGKQQSFTQASNSQFIENIFSKNDLVKFKQWDQKVDKIFSQTEIRPLPAEVLKLKDISFADWMRKKSGLPKKVQEFVRIQSEPEYATSWENISALEGILEWHIFTGEGSHSYHIIGGNQKLTEAIAENIGKDSVTLNTKVTRIESKFDGVTVEGVDQGSYQTRTFSSKYVVTTIPLFRLLELQFIPSLSEDLKQAIHSQTWGSYFTAHVILDGSAKSIVGLDKLNSLPLITDSPLGVVYGGIHSNQKNIATPESSVMLNLLIFGSHAERFNLRAVTAMDSVRQELTEAFNNQWPGSGKLIKKFEFYQYHPRAIASWPVGRSRLDEQSELFRKPQGRVYFAGDYTEGTHSDGAAISAVRVVKDILNQEKSAKKIANRVVKK